MYYIRNIDHIKINDLYLRTINGYKIYKKGRDVLLYIDNEVFTNEIREFLLSVIVNSNNLYNISITETTIDDMGLTNKLKTTFLCGIAEGKIYEGKYDKTSNTLPIFKIINVHESEVE